MHFHTLVAQGVFADDGAGELRFVPLPAPTDRAVERLLGVVRRRVVRLAAATASTWRATGSSRSIASMPR